MITPESQLLRDAIRAGTYTTCCSDCDHSPRKEWEWAIARIYELESAPPPESP